MINRRVLVIDDDIYLREVLHEILSDDGYDVREASDGMAALDTLAEWTPAVIILDLMMPVMDGREFRARQRDLGRAIDVPVIVLSASRQIDAAAELDAARILAKPFEMDELLSAVQSLREG